jgi:hypothetical protein
MVTTS